MSPAALALCVPLEPANVPAGASTNSDSPIRIASDLSSLAVETVASLLREPIVVFGELDLLSFPGAGDVPPGSALFGEGVRPCTGVDIVLDVGELIPFAFAFVFVFAFAFAFAFAFPVAAAAAAAGMEILSGVEAPTPLATPGDDWRQDFAPASPHGDDFELAFPERWSCRFA